ncbi:unnamed protein product [Diatraea saccharalis]|uniref:Uncharacterized protein n=1 Tax=Diatraea saccharalis TaxID=40085 RepID=A0A9N9R5N4_9NEOP|nr:unnamed protein product [Diatraea saccharalis]
MVKKCCVYACPSESYGGCNISFHSLPKNEDMRRKWLSIVHVKQKITKNSVVCSRHFQPSSFYIGNSRRLLKSDAIPSISPAACRICLVMDIKLISMSKYKLEQAYEQLTGVSLLAEKRLPNELCAECAQRLINFSRFRHKSLRANSLMVELLNEYNELTKSIIQSINRENNQLISNLTTETIIDHYDLYIEEVDDEDVDLNTTMNIEDEEINDVNDDDHSSVDSLPLEETKESEEYIRHEMGEENNEDEEEINNDMISNKYNESDDKDDDCSADDNLPLEETREESDEYIRYEMVEENNAYEEEINNDMISNKYNESDDKDDDCSTDDNLPLEEESLETREESEEYFRYEMVEENSEDEEVINDDMISNKYDEFDDKHDYSSDNSLTLEETKKGKQNMRKVRVKSDKHGETKVDGQKKTFGDEYLKIFNVTDLTLREQLADIENRKKSLNYKNSPFKCAKCYKGFSNAITYNAHMIRHTTACGEYSCSICKIHFKSRYMLKNHNLRNHTQRLSCKQCSYVTTYRESAKLHSEWHNGMKYKCPYCGEVFYKKSSYMGHVRIKHPSDFVCVLCGYSFVSEKGITVHKNLKHRLNNKPIPEDGPVCEICDLRFLDAEAFERHLSVSARHEGVDGKERNEPSLRRLGRWKRTKRKNDEGPITCEQCGVQLKTWRDYHIHFRKKHPEKNRTKYTSVKSLSMCEVCGKIFYSDALLNDHKWVHEGKRNFKCDICDKSFLTKQSMLMHKRAHSAEKSVYECQLCGKQIGNYSNMQRHMLIHTGLKPWKCEFCGKAFKQPSEKRAHTAHVHLKKPWPKRIRGKRRTDGQQVTVNQQPVSPSTADLDTSDVEL